MTASIMRLNSKLAVELCLIDGIRYEEVGFRLRRRRRAIIEVGFHIGECVLSELLVHLSVSVE